MNILLISPVVAPNRIPGTYNIGLGYIAASLVEEGYNVDVLDFDQYRGQNMNDVHRMVTDQLKKKHYDIVGTGAIITAFCFIRQVVEFVKDFEPNIPVWIGNSVSSTIPELLLKETKADVAVIDEGEITVKELARKLINKNQDLSDVQGIYYKTEEGKIKKNAPRPFIKDIDSIPMPQWDLFPQEVYISSPKYKGKRIIFLNTTRGCPYKCTYCYHPYGSRKVRFHSPERMIQEVQLVMDKFNIKRILFADDLNLVNKNRIYKFCDLLEKEKIKIEWYSNIRADLVDENFLRRIKECGCVHVGIGFESCSKTILENINKGTTPEQNLRAVEIFKRVGINYGGSFMIGNVGETRRTAYETLKVIKKMDITPTRPFFFPQPYPGTELWNYAKNHNLIEDDLKFVESLGEQGDNIVVNFTDMTNEELFDLRKEIIRKWKTSYFLHHPLYMITVLKKETARIISKIKKEGLMHVLKRLPEILLKKFA